MEISKEKDLALPNEIWGLEVRDAQWQHKDLATLHPLPATTWSLPQPGVRQCSSPRPGQGIWLPRPPLTWRLGGGAASSTSQAVKAWRSRSGPGPPVHNPVGLGIVGTCKSTIEAAI